LSTLYFLGNTVSFRANFGGFVTRFF